MDEKLRKYVERAPDSPIKTELTKVRRLLAHTLKAVEEIEAELRSALPNPTGPVDFRGVVDGVLSHVADLSASLAESRERCAEMAAEIARLREKPSSAQFRAGPWEPRPCGWRERLLIGEDGKPITDDHGVVLGAAEARVPVFSAYIPHNTSRKCVKIGEGAATQEEAERQADDALRACGVALEEGGAS